MNTDDSIITNVEMLSTDKVTIWRASLDNGLHDDLLVTALPDSALQGAEHILKLNSDISQCLMGTGLSCAKGVVYRIYSHAISIYIIRLIKDRAARYPEIPNHTSEVSIPNSILYQELQQHFSVDPTNLTNRWNYVAVEWMMDIFAHLKPDSFRIMLGTDDICISYHDALYDIIYYVQILPLIN